MSVYQSDIAAKGNRYRSCRNDIKISVGETYGDDYSMNSFYQRNTECYRNQITVNNQSIFEKDTLEFDFHLSDCTDCEQDIMKDCSDYEGSVFRIKHLFYRSPVQHMLVNNCEIGLIMRSVCLSVSCYKVKSSMPTLSQYQRFLEDPSNHAVCLRFGMYVDSTFMQTKIIMNDSKFLIYSNILINLHFLKKVLYAILLSGTYDSSFVIITFPSVDIFRQYQPRKRCSFSPSPQQPILQSDCSSSIK